MLFRVSTGYAAGIDTEEGDFWFCPGGEIALYSPSGVSYGGGIAIGYGKGTSIGMKTVWFPDFGGGISVLEINFLVRFYFSGKHGYSRSFIQFMGGPAFFFGEESNGSIPSRLGAFSIGIGYGWRFLIKDRWFIEPSVRFGYPYMAGAGLSAGMRF